MSSSIDIVDIRGQQISDGEEPNGPLRREIIQGLTRPHGSKTLPTLLLYNEHGLRLYDRITTDAPEYYLFPAEEQILKEHAGEIVQFIHGQCGQEVMGEVVVELGAG